MVYSLRRITFKMYNMKEMVYVSSHKKTFIRFAIYVALIFLTVTVSFSPHLWHKKHISTPRNAKFPTDLRYILFWKPKDNPDQNKDKGLEFVVNIPKNKPQFTTGQTLFIKQKCPFINCYITYDKSLLKHDWYFDAVVFDIHDIKRKKISDFNLTRASYQNYIFRSMESAETHYICSKNFENFFNWTWTYRLDSDIPHPFLNVYNLNNTIVGPNINMTWIEKMKRIDKFSKKVEKKHIAVAWILNNCKAKEKHKDFYEEFKKELKGYNYTIHTYGSCGDHKCPYGALYKCYKMIEKEYFFQLVSEDSFDNDYVTERLVKVMQLATIPIVLGGADYKRFLPPGTYINAVTFDMKKLGAIIDYLIKNRKTYTYFFDWKHHYRYNLRPRNYVCDLCKKLNEQNSVTDIKTQFRKWWNPDYENVCLRNHLYYKFTKNVFTTESSDSTTL